MLTVSPPPKASSKNRACRPTLHCKDQLSSGSEGLFYLLTGALPRYNLTLCRIVFTLETLLCGCGFKSELTSKRHGGETQSRPVPGESANLNVLSYFSMTVAVWSSLVVFPCWWAPGAILRWRPNPVPVNQMKAVRRGLEVVCEWIRIWLGCSLRIFWRALSATNIWRTSPGTRGPCKAELEEWRTNEALRHYHRGDAADSRVAVQTTSHIFHVSKRFFSDILKIFSNFLVSNRHVELFCQQFQNFP